MVTDLAFLWVQPEKSGSLRRTLKVAFNAAVEIWLGPAQQDFRG